MIRLSTAALALGALALTSCSSGSTDRPVAEVTIPSSCSSTAVLAAVQAEVPRAEVIDVPWEPAAGTELADVIYGNGLVCAFGEQQAELGSTVMWLDDATEIIDTRRVEWQNDGFTQVEVKGADEAWFLFREGEITEWRVNLVVGDIWIQVRSSIDRTFDDGRDLVLSAIESLGT